MKITKVQNRYFKDPTFRIGYKQTCQFNSLIRNTSEKSDENKDIIIECKQRHVIIIISFDNFSGLFSLLL